MMVTKNGQQFPYFIDYQNCRFGPKEYDLASFLWQSSAQYPQYIRKKLIDCYIDSLNELRPNVNAKTVYENLDFMVLFRIIQVLGAYGFRGFVEHKSYFLNSIPYAIYNLKKAKSNHDVIENYYIPNMNFEKVDELKNQLIESQKNNSEPGYVFVNVNDSLVNGDTHYSEEYYNNMIVPANIAAYKVIKYWLFAQSGTLHPRIHVSYLFYA